jgi:3-oxoacyl-[acyl-carrier protein] reductase
MGSECHKLSGARLEGKCAIVTGSATGIGKATATLFAQEGARIVVSDVDEAGRGVVEAIKGDGGEATFVKADVSQAGDAERMVDTMVRTYGRLDVLVNNAAVYLGDGNILTVADETWNQIIGVNLKGTYLCCKFAIARMIETGGGSIVNLSSVNALMGLSLTAYTASKGGVQALTRLLAVDFGPKGIRVNSICPGTIMTENSIAIYRERTGLAESVTRMYPMGKLGAPVDVAECALYLASDASSFVTGASFVVDGGLMAGRKFELDYT